MGTSKMPTKKGKILDKISDKAGKIAGIVTAIVAVIGAAVGAFSWVSSQFTNAVSSQISGFQQEVRDADKADKQATTRIELMVLMEHDSDNIVAIERMAKYYFQELDGDLYMTQKVSDWCKSHGIDCSVIIGGK